MGGSGGGRYIPTPRVTRQPTPSQQSRLVRVRSTISRFLKRVSQADEERVEWTREAVLRKLRGRFGRVHGLRGGGSYARGTFVSGLSDIDLLIDLGKYSESTIPDRDDPHKLLEYTADSVRELFPRADIRVGRMAVTIEFPDGLQVQLLPAFRVTDGYRIPDPDRPGWITTRPQRFANVLQRRNHELAGQLLPAIKLTKWLCESHNIPVRSYHVETLAIKAFEDYQGSTDHPQMIKHFFDYAKEAVLRPVPDITGQQRYVDEYLETRRERTELAAAMKRMYDTVQSAGESPNSWERLLAEH